jgi:hypothetical protein
MEVRVQPDRMEPVIYDPLYPAARHPPRFHWNA